MDLRQRVEGAITWLVGIVALVVMTSVPAQASGQNQFLASSSSSSCTYEVQPGDWLSRIAPKFGMSWQTLYNMNRAVIGPNPDALRMGTLLSVCSGHTPPPDPPATNTPTSTGSGFELAAEPCHSTLYATGTISLWKIPPGCFANVYTPNPKNFPSKPGWGWCNWWPEVLHPSWNIMTMPRHHVPRLGAAIVFAPGEQGASAIGHWGGEVIWISPDLHWFLMSEMNDTWRGAGFGKVNYRYVRIESGVTFVY